ncbi:pilus assembly FimT family protein [Marinicauda pacifica]|uniref:pilus assembly FimT family protein n=1 Tax=Marinicauda pacifica TaxID=1133559 RepID=UPI0035C7FF40
MRGQRGYSLLEILVVLAILAVAATISVPLVGNMVDRYRAHSVATDLQSHLIELRTRAVLEATDLSQASISETLNDALPAGWAIELDEAISFRANGYCPGGPASLTSPAGRVRPLVLEAGRCFIESGGTPRREAGFRFSARPDAER